MAFSAAVVAGVGLACAVAALVLAFVFFAWHQRKRFNRRPASGLTLIEEQLRTCLGIVEAVVQLDLEFDKWSPASHFSSLQHAVELHVSKYYRGQPTNPDRPFDAKKLELLAGGPFKNWDAVPSMDLEDRKITLRHAIYRALSSRMNLDGDPTITLLPVDILTVYQRFLTKPPWQDKFIFNITPWDGKARRQFAWILRQYWRTLTFNWSTELYRPPWQDETLPARPDAIRAFCGHSNEIGEDDPRMPNILALEAKIEDALAPFWKGEYAEWITGDIDEYRLQEQTEAKKSLRDIMTIAADMTLINFGSLEAREFFWPESDTREGLLPFKDRGKLELFGTRRPKWYWDHFWSKSHSLESLESMPLKIERPPVYDDTDELILWWESGRFRELQAEVHEHEKGRQDDEGESEAETEEWKEKKRLLKALEEYYAIDIHRELMV